MGTALPILEFMPVGFRFRPTDEELVNHYLKHKLLGDDFVTQIIPEADLCKVEPWDIPALSVIKSDDPEWFFFSRRDYKYPKSTRYNRLTEHGYWKATGKDRNIKTTGTNNVIGTKKTLVFHQNRVPHGVKTNWVIHEYHAVTFDVSLRTFVLCRLMKKSEKKGEGETDARICGEGGPSSHMTSDYEILATEERIPGVCAFPEVSLEPIFQATTQAEEIQQSPTFFEQEASFSNSPFINAFLRNENSFMPLPSETTEEEDNAFLNSILADEEDIVINEERRHAFVNGHTPSVPLRRVYYESSDTDAEVVSARYGNTPDTSTVCKEHASSRPSRVLKMAPSSNVLHGGARPVSSAHDASRDKKDSILWDDIWGVETSSSDSTADKPLEEINVMEISSSPSTLRICKTQNHSRPSNFISQRAATRRSQTQRKVSSNAASHHEAKKEFPIMESQEDRKRAQNTSSRKNLKSRSNQSSDGNGRGSFNCMETASLSQSPVPRSVYLVNVAIGIFLLIVIIWGLLSC